MLLNACSSKQLRTKSLFARCILVGKRGRGVVAGSQPIDGTFYVLMFESTGQMQRMKYEFGSKGEIVVFLKELWSSDDVFL